MKILHITNNLWSGGVTTLLEELLSYLSKENEVTLLLLGKNEEKYNEEKFKNVKIIFLNQNKLYSIENIFKIRKLIKENDITHSHLFPSQYITIMASLFLDKKIITTEHTTWNRRRNKILFKPLEKFIYKKYSKIITVSEAARINLINWVGMKEKITAIPNGVDLEKYTNGKNIRNELWDLKENEKLICMVARFSKQKDQKTLIKAMKLLPDEIKCIFVGVGETLEEIKKYVLDNKLDNRIKFLGYRNDVEDILNSIDLNILSTNYEGLPLIILETLATGTLMLGSKVEGVDEILKYNKFLFEKGNEKELAEKIKLFLYDEEIIKIEKEKIKKIIEEYSLEKTIKNYKKIYLEDTKWN